MKKWLAIALGIVTATGGFVDVGAIATAGGAGAGFGLGLVWAMVLGTLAIVLLVEMAGRLAAVSGKTYAEVIRERFGFKFYVVPLTSEFIANAILLAADLGGIAIPSSDHAVFRMPKQVPSAIRGRHSSIGSSVDRYSGSMVMLGMSWPRPDASSAVSRPLRESIWLSGCG